MSEVDKCPICHEEIEYYALSSCNHTLCARCAVKLKCFSKANDEENIGSCPTCMKSLRKIIITKKQQKFQLVPPQSLYSRGADTYVEGLEASSYYTQLVSCRCATCKKVFKTMEDLNEHTIQWHSLYYCDICLKSARLLPDEFKTFTQEQLKEHYRDSNFGHPECEFCTIKFYDFEKLLLHARSEHFVCDFCARSKIYHIFKVHEELWNHFRQTHFVCEECAKEDKMMAFVSQLELGAHHYEAHLSSQNNGKTKGNRRQVLVPLANRRVDVSDSESQQENVFTARNSATPSVSYDTEDETDVRFAFSNCKPSVNESREDQQDVIHTASLVDFPALVPSQSTQPVVKLRTFSSNENLSANKSATVSVPKSSKENKPPTQPRESNTKLSYYPVEEYTERNIQLYTDIRSAVQSHEFQLFITDARKYRNGKLDFKDFFSQTRSYLGKKIHDKFLPELIALLDDIALQRDIFSQLKPNVKSQLKECSKCGQITRVKDYAQHASVAH